MSSFMESICKIGIFMIAAQAVIHFAPAAKYEKYMRLVVGIIVLLQFLVPINKITDGIDGDWEAESDWSGQLANMEMEMELEKGLSVEGGENGGSFSENFISGMEMEIKSRLNSALDDENYSILKVNVVMDSSGGGNGQYHMQYDNENNNGYETYRLNAIQVYVMAQDVKNGIINYGNYVEKDVDGNDSYAYSDADGNDSYADRNAESSNNYSDTNEESNGSHTNMNADRSERGNEDDNSSVVKVEKIHINKIGADEDDVNMDDTGKATFYEKQEDNKQKGNKQKESGRLREKFCTVLGIEERYMEVSIYGWIE